MLSKHFVLAFVILSSVLIAGCIKDGKPAICPPPGLPQPPGCGPENAQQATEAGTVVEAAEPKMVVIDLTVTVPYWTDGDVYLGVGENAAYLKLNKVNEVTYSGTMELENGAEYYYSRGSIATKSLTTYKTTDVPTGVNAVVDWIDSDKKISMPGFKKGVLFGGHTLWMGFENPGFIEYVPGIIDYNLDLVEASGVDWIVIDNFWFEYPDCRDVQEIIPYTPDDGPWPDTQGWTLPTQPDEHLKEVIAKAKERGLHVALKPVVVSFAKSPTRDVPCHENVPDWDKWFEDYTKFAVHFGELAEDTGVELYIFATEQDIAMDPKFSNGPTNPTERWRKIINEVRKVYSGEITVSVSCTLDADRLDWPCDGPAGVKFWDQLDYIGFEPYFSFTEKNNPTVNDIKTSFGQRLDSPSFTHAKELGDMYKKPVLFTEISPRSYTGASHYQLQIPGNPEMNVQEQADIFEGVMQATEERPWINGSFYWAWYLLKPGAELDPHVFTGNLAGQVLKKWYSKIET